MDLVVRPVIMRDAFNSVPNGGVPRWLQHSTTCVRGFVAGGVVTDLKST